jgi:hypothetical protein
MYLQKKLATEPVCLFHIYLCIHLDRIRNRTEDTSPNTVEPLITDTAGEFKFCPL